MSAQRISRGFAWNHLYKVVEYGLINLYTILVVRKFGPELAGSYAVYLSVSGTLAILCAFGVDGVLLRFLPRVDRGDRAFGDYTVEGVRPFVLELLGFRLAVVSVVAFLVAIVLGWLPHVLPGLSIALGSLADLWPFMIVYLFAQAVIAFSTFTLLGLLKVRWVFFASLTSRILLVLAGFLALLNGELTLYSAVAIHAFGALLNALLLLYWLHRKVDLPLSRGLGEEARTLLKKILGYWRKPSLAKLFLMTPFMLYGLATWGSDLLSTVLGRQPDILMMRAMLGEQARDIGLYQSAAQLVLLTEYVFLFGFGGTLVSVFSELVHQDEASGPSSISRFPKLFSARREVAGFQTVTTAPLFAFMMAFAPLVIEVIYGPGFRDASRIVVAGLSLLAAAVVVYGGGMHITSLVVIGKERLVFRNRLAWGAFNLIINYFLIRSYGAIGAMIGTQATNFGACLVEGLYARKLIGESARLKQTGSIILIAAAAAALSFFVGSIVPPGWLSIYRLLIVGTVMAVATLGLYWIFRIPEAIKLLGRLNELLARRTATAS